MMTTPGRVTPDPFVNDDVALSLPRTMIEPSDDDVVFSRSRVKSAQSSPGNVDFKNKAMQWANAYRVANSFGKVFVARQLVRTVTERKGRFLRPHEGTVGWRTATTAESFKAAMRALQRASIKSGIQEFKQLQNQDAQPYLGTALVLAGNNIAMKDSRKIVSQTASQGDSGAVAHEADISVFPQHNMSTSSQYNRLLGIPGAVGLHDVTHALQSARDLAFLANLHVDVGEASDGGIETFAKALQDYSRLCPNRIQSLYIKLSPHVNHESAKQLAIGCRRCRGLRTVQIEFQGARRKFANLLVAAAIGNPTVTSLHLDGNQLGCRGAGWIASILQICTKSNVQFISLKRNGISSVGAMAVRRLLRSTGRTIRVEFGDMEPDSDDNRSLVLIPDEDGDDNNSE